MVEGHGELLDARFESCRTYFWEEMIFKDFLLYLHVKSVILQIGLILQATY